MKNLKFKKLVVLAAITLAATATVIPIKASAAWKQSDNGMWSYTDGNSAISGWKLIEGKWYFFDSSSIMKTGWVNDGGKWYYLETSGAMKTGWINDGAKWYYAAPSGNMQTGWLNNNGSWYYLNSSGDMHTGLLDINGKTYYLSESGAMKTGNITINGVNYTFAASGEKTASPATTQTTTDATATDATTVSSGGSGGSGGGSGSGGGPSKASAEALYGTWTVGDYVSSNLDSKMTDDQIALCQGQSITITKSSISFNNYEITIPNPSISAKTMTSSDFYNKYNIKISGSEVQCFTATIKITSLDKSASVTVFISDDGDSYALLKGAFFKIEK